MIVSDTSAHFETGLFAVSLQSFIAHFFSFFHAHFLLGSNSVPDEGLKAPTQASERIKGLHCWF